MIRDVIVGNRYGDDDFSSLKSDDILNKNYSVGLEGSTECSFKFPEISSVLSSNLDVFSELSSDVWDDDDARSFLLALKKCILDYEKTELRGIVLPKLYANRVDEKSLVIEWISNYFRVFFAFNKNEGDYFGDVVNDMERGKFYNTVRKMEPSEFNLVAEANLFYVIMMLQGNNER